MSPTTVEEREYMTRVPYASAIGSLMYVIVCKRSDLSQVVSMISRYMHDPRKGYWVAIKWVLRLDWYSRRILRVSRSVSDMLTPTMQETLTNQVYNRVCVYIIPGTGELAFYSTVYRYIFYYRGRVHGHDGGYEGGNMASGIAR